MITATYKVRTRNGRTVKMTGSIEDLDEITKVMQRATATSDLLAVAESNLKTIKSLYTTDIDGTLGPTDFCTLGQAIADTEAAIAAAKG